MKRSSVSSSNVIKTVALVLLMASAAVADVGEESEGPSLELLEFLGEWENGDGLSVDPFQLQDVEEDAILQLTDE